MNLELINDLLNKVKENNIVQNFIKELGTFLEENQEKEISLLEKTQKENKVTVEYRDKMSVERRKILENFAEKTQEKGPMYYIYDKSNNYYLVSICEKAKSNEIIKISENDLPKETKVDSILRKQNEKYVLDIETTKEITEQMDKRFNELLEEQTKKMQAQRIEGHLYEFVEKSADSIWLLDKNNNTGNVFEEFEFSHQTFENAKQGDTFKYINGQYTK